MVNAQEYVNSLYPKEERAKIKKLNVNVGGKILQGHLDLREFESLTEFYCSSSNLTSIDFLNTLPNPEKLEYLSVSDNDIQPTDIAFFSKFVNLKEWK